MADQKPAPKIAAMSLSQLYDTAIGANPGLAAAASRSKSSSMSADNAYFGFAPRVSAIGDAEREGQGVISTQNPVYQVGHGIFSNKRASVEADLPIIDYRLFAKLDAAKAAARHASYNETSAQQKLTYDLIEAYILAIAAQDSRNLADAEQHALEEHASIVRQRVTSGVANDDDLSQVASRRDQAKAESISAASAVRQAFAVLERITGSEVKAIYRFKSSFPIVKPAPATPDQWLDSAQSNPEILGLIEAVSEADAAYHQAIGQILPHLDLRSSFNYNDAGGSLYGGGARTTDTVVTLRLSIPIFNADGEGYVFRAENERATEARYAVEDKKLALAQKVRGALSDAISGADRAAALGSALSNSFQHLQALREKFSGGQGSVNDILESEGEYFHVKKLQLQAKYNYLLSMMQLKEYSGLISGADIEYLDKLLDRQASALSGF